MQATSRVGGGDGCSINTSSTSSVADRLRTSLAQTGRLLAEFEREQEQFVVIDMKTYNKCCKQLVTYMVTHMETSRDFVQQMEKVIQASYNNSGGFTLSSTGAEELWLHYNRTTIIESDVETSIVPQTPSSLGPMIETDTAMNVGVTVTPHAVANDIGLRPTCSPHVDLSESTPATVGREGKRQTKKGRLVPRHDLKRTRHTVARNLYGAGSLDCKDEDNMGLKSSKESETELETEVLGESYEDSTFDQGVDNSLVLGDRIVWPCAGANPLDRNPAFMERLKLAVALVDAENCCPPPGMKCMQGCTSLRFRMCQSHRIQGGNASVCHDKMCCVWRDIDTHLVRCRNSDCEFKNSVGLRQAMHDILQNEVKLKATSDKLLVAKAMISETVGARDHRSSISASQIESRIRRLEEKCSKLEDAILLHKDRQRAFKFDLNALGIPPPKCESEDVPSFQSHYARKRPRD